MKRIISSKKLLKVFSAIVALTLAVGSDLAYSIVMPDFDPAKSQSGNKEGIIPLDNLPAGSEKGSEIGVGKTLGPVLENSPQRGNQNNNNEGGKNQNTGPAQQNQPVAEKQSAPVLEGDKTTVKMSEAPADLKAALTRPDVKAAPTANVKILMNSQAPVPGVGRYVAEVAQESLPAGTMKAANQMAALNAGLEVNLDDPIESKIAIEYDLKTDKKGNVTMTILNATYVGEKSIKFESNSDTNMGAVWGAMFKPDITGAGMVGGRGNPESERFVGGTAYGKLSAKGQEQVKSSLREQLSKQPDNGTLKARYDAIMSGKGDDLRVCMDVKVVSIGGKDSDLKEMLVTHVTLTPPVKPKDSSTVANNGNNAQGNQNPRDNQNQAQGSQTKVENQVARQFQSKEKDAPKLELSKDGKLEKPGQFKIETAGGQTKVTFAEGTKINLPVFAVNGDKKILVDQTTIVTGKNFSMVGDSKMVEQSGLFSAAVTDNDGLKNNVEQIKGLSKIDNGENVGNAVGKGDMHVITVGNVNVAAGKPTAQLNVQTFNGEFNNSLVKANPAVGGVGHPAEGAPAATAGKGGTITGAAITAALASVIPAITGYVGKIFKPAAEPKAPTAQTITQQNQGGQVPVQTFYISTQDSDKMGAALQRKMDAKPDAAPKEKVAVSMGLYNAFNDYFKNRPTPTETKKWSVESVKTYEAQPGKFNGYVARIDLGNSQKVDMTFKFKNDPSDLAILNTQWQMAK